MLACSDLLSIENEIRLLVHDSSYLKHARETAHRADGDGEMRHGDLCFLNR
jgi:hypothetical protein